MARPNLLFIDTNIWLDFYRVKNENDLKLLKRIDTVKDRLIATYQLEIEFNANRQRVISESLRHLEGPRVVPRLGMFSDARDFRMITRRLKEVEKRLDRLRSQLIQALGNPQRDTVYKICQQHFQRQNPLSLDRDNLIRRSIRRAAYRRFLHGCPPRKSGDTSYGDAFNWEWMLHCAAQQKTGLAIVSRDSDYGVTLGNKSYVNDHLRREFGDRVGRRRPLLLFSSLTDALRSFDIPVSAKEEEAEKALSLNSYGAVPARMRAFYGEQPLSTWYKPGTAIYGGNVLYPSSFDVRDILNYAQEKIMKVEDSELLSAFGRSTHQKSEDGPTKPK